MKLQILSDIHLEFGWPMSSQAFIEMLDPSDVDVLVLAGDICTETIMLETMRLLCRRYENSQVLWVHGNHEYYGSDFETITKKAKIAMNENSNLKWLERDIIEINKQRFLGATSWFAKSNDTMLYEHRMNDFYQIRGAREFIYDASLKTKEFFRNEMQKNDIVITHHLPSERSVQHEFKGSPLNCFYVHNHENIIIERQPKLWIHGHTHRSVDYTFKNKRSQTRVLANPRGYYGHELNDEFVRDMKVDI